MEIRMERKLFGNELCVYSFMNPFNVDVAFQDMLHMPE